MTDTAPDWNFEPSENKDLENEVYSTRVGDLIDKLENTLKEANYPPEEIVPALGCLLTTRFLDAENPDRMFRIFIQMLSEEFDKAMEGFYD